MKNFLFLAMTFIASSFVVAQTIKTPFENAISSDGLKPGSYTLIADITATISSHDATEKEGSWAISVTNPTSTSITTVLVEFVLPDDEQTAPGIMSSGIIYDYHKIDTQKKRNKTLLMAVSDDAGPSLPDAYTDSIDEMPEHWSKFEINQKYKSIQNDTAPGAGLTVFVNTDASNLFSDDKAELSLLALKRYEEIQLIKRLVIKVQQGMVSQKVASKIIMNILVCFVKPEGSSDGNG